MQALQAYTLGWHFMLVMLPCLYLILFSGHYPESPAKFGELLLRIPELQRTCQVSLNVNGNVFSVVKICVLIGGKRNVNNKAEGRRRRAVVQPTHGAAPGRTLNEARLTFTRKRHSIIVIIKRTDFSSEIFT